MNRAIHILLTTNGAVLVSAAMIGPIYALIVERVGGDLLDASIAGGVFALAGGLTTFVSGRISDKVKETELVVVAGYLAIAIGFLGYAFVQNFWQLLVIQVIIGFGEAVYSPAFDALYSLHMDRKKSGSTWGAWEMMNYFALAGGAFVGGMIVTYFSFSVLFLVMSLACLCSATYIYHLPRKVL